MKAPRETRYARKQNLHLRKQNVSDGAFPHLMPGYKTFRTWFMYVHIICAHFLSRDMFEDLPAT